MAKKGIERPLGPTEEMFWRFDALSPLNFSFAARIAGDLDLGELRQAIDAVQMRHPLLRVRVECDSKDVPWFRLGAGRIPLHVRDVGVEETWSAVEASLNTSLDSVHGPMAYFVLLRHGPGDATLQLVFHHAISDGRSAVFMLRDLLLSLARQRRYEMADLVELPPAGYYGDRIPTIEHYEGLDGLRTAWKTLKASVRFLEGAGLPVGLKTEGAEQAPPVEPKIFVEPRFLSGHALKRLLDRAKKERTTMQCVLNAALSMSVAEDSPPGPLQRTSCTQVVDIRSRLVPPVEDDVGCFASGVTSLHSIDASTRFWPFAREIRAHMDHSMATPLPFFHQAMHTVYTNLGRGLGFSEPRVFSEVMSSIHPEGLAVSNLGRVELHVEGSPIRITELAFATNTSVLNDLSTSAVTYGGRMTWAFNGSSKLGRERVARIDDRSMQKIAEAVESE